MRAQHIKSHCAELHNSIQKSITDSTLSTIKGEKWYFLSPIAVTYENCSVDGQITVDGTVERFENVTIFSNTTYQTAVVKQTTTTGYSIDKTNYSVSNESTLWYGQDIGLIDLTFSQKLTSKIRLVKYLTDGK